MSEIRNCAFGVRVKFVLGTEVDCCGALRSTVNVLHEREPTRSVSDRYPALIRGVGTGIAVQWITSTAHERRT